MELHEEAAQAFAEGLQHLAPFYRDLPQAHSRVGNGLVQGYLQACKKAGLEPDAALLSQFAELSQI
jgi:predicted HicB family RNase H-like nuclease